jgi:zinc transport system permease protein
MMLIATLIGGALNAAGLALSYGPDLPAGPTIILLAGGLYIVSALVSRTLARRQARLGASGGKGHVR